jgi:hypothetical protein
MYKSNVKYNLYEQVSEEEFAFLLNKGIISLEEAKFLYEQSKEDEQDLQDCF